MKINLKPEEIREERNMSYAEFKAEYIPIYKDYQRLSSNKSRDGVRVTSPRLDHLRWLNPNWAVKAEKETKENK